MSDHNISYTIEEVAALLKVSKLTVYDLIKKNELTSYRVGRQMRVDSTDLESYKLRTKNRGVHQAAHSNKDSNNLLNPRTFVISGQDIALDLLAKQLEKEEMNIRPLRLYTGSLNSLISMYQNQCDLVSLHLFDGDTGTYNIPYVKKIMTGIPFIVINFLSRWAGLYVQKGNPKNISGWMDLNRDDISIINREKGAGARVLLDEQLRIHGIRSVEVNGYSLEETSHLAVAAAIKGEKADVGIGIEHAAKITDLDFIPLIKERYDLVLLKTEENAAIIEKLKETLSSSELKKELKMMGDYDLTETGKVIFETF
ncbi:helix-turn-helix transcriptional regulator [Bacillus sp. S/N-304-OC-R1]|uniref:helix-turn-helix transcriptional regulator n=1 Tax=Bacillus sp. S/N-304-OC-R1 TaxID=2758034 RepID=UPI001C8D0008|nr:helix-turn-helix transcriptional regulator [Bacillus sp. S/N-304-OC-R1]MBY0120389.1 helix-turn-helix transcriptional regulator [Bacillus sp. S/N-304-OC-R1]